MGILTKKANTLRATSIYGSYKDKHIKINIGKTGNDTIIKINEKKIDNCVGTWIKIIPGKPTTLFMEFVKLEDW